MAAVSYPGESSAATPQVGTAGPFVRAPREIRDHLYRFLLSTKHTQHVHVEPDMPGSTYIVTGSNATTLKYTYTYRFHTSILLTNRQIYHEASHVFYMENLFVRVSSIELWPIRLLNILGGWKEYALPVFANGSKVAACKRHVTEIEANVEPWGSMLPNCLFILASSDLLMFCRALRLMNARRPFKFGLLLGMDLRVTIGDKISTAGLDQSKGMVKNKSRLSRMSADNSPRVRRLLEPLRALHSIRSPYIDAPISQRYQQQIEISLSRVEPETHELFPTVMSAYEDANRTLGAGDFALAIHKLNDTLDILFESSVQTTGHDLESYLGMRYTMLKNLARANSKFPTDLACIRTAQSLARRTIEIRLKDGRCDGGAHGNAMDHYLEAEIWEALDRLGEHNDRPRSETLRDVIGMLKEALRYEPGNSMLQREFERRRKEKATAETMEELMEMEKGEGAVQSRERSADGRVLEPGE